MAVGIPTSKSHDKAMLDLLGEFNAILVNGEQLARTKRIEMAAGAVGDEVIKALWDFFASAELRINEIRRTPDFHDEYARYRGLAYFFNCTDDVNAALDNITGLPDNHKFKVNHAIDFKLNDGALTGGLSEDTNFYVMSSGLSTITITNAIDGTATSDLTNAVGTAEMILNIKPDLSTLRTAIDAILDEIEANLTQRATTYDRTNLIHTTLTRDTTATATLRTKLTDFENLVDVVPA